MDRHLITEVRFPVIALAVTLLVGVAASFPALSQEAARIVNVVTHCSSANPCATYVNAGTGSGVKGTSAKGNGVNGQTTFVSTSVANATAGVFGQDLATTTIHNLGVNGTSTLGIGVLGTTTSGFAGVYGQTFNGSSTSPGDNGVEGVDQSTDGGGANAGVAGLSASGSGVYGNSQTGTAILGIAGNGIGITGSSGTTTGVLAQGNAAIVAESEPGAATQDNLRSFDGLGNETANLDSAGNLHLSGKVFTAGKCSTGCAVTRTTNGSDVVAFHPRESEPTMEDVGEGQLVKGRAYIRLERGFAGTIDLRSPYLVFITPQGDTRGLYVTDKTHDGFSVRESQGGGSSATFDYRIVAKPADMHASRLPAFHAAAVGREPEPAIRVRTPRKASLR
jgi:hypothetical protein